MKDIRYAFRKLVKTPLFTIVTILCLALGIGANTAIFSVINTILLRPLPFADVTRVIFMGDIFEGPGAEGRRVGVTSLNFNEMRERNEVFAHVGAVLGQEFTLTGGDEPLQLTGALVTWDWMTTLGIRPVEGRAFGPEDDMPGQPADVVIIGHGLRQRRFGTADVIGERIILNGRPHTIVGVLDRFTQYPYDSELWTPMGLDPEGPMRNNHQLGVFGLMKPGVTWDRARLDLDRIYRELAEQYPDTNKGWSVKMYLLRDNLLGEVPARLFMLFAAVAFLLLIACANVANLMLARAQGQMGEIVVRLTLGASRRQLIRQLLTESILVALIGGVLGLFLAMLSLKPLVALSPMQTMHSFYQNITIDWRVLAFTLLVSLVVGVVFGLIPALRSTNPDLQSTLRQGGQRGGVSRWRRRLLDSLVIAETALAIVLLVGAGLMIDSLGRLQSQDPGFPTDNLLSLRFNLTPDAYPDNAANLVLFEQVLAELRALPEVESAGVGGALPLATENADRRLAACTVEGRPLASANDFLIFNHRLVSPGYLETLNVPLVEGRYFGSEDHADSVPVAIVSKETARLYWPGESAVGKRLKRGGPSSTNPWMTIVGVVDDVADHTLGVPTSEVGPTWYLPYTQHNFRRLAVTMRTRVPPMNMVRQVKETMSRFAPDLPLYNVETMDGRMETSFRAKKFTVLLLQVFSGLGLFLAALGVYSIMSYVVSEQQRDIGIRMALGSTGKGVLALILRRGLSLTLIGLGIGLAGAAALSRLLTRIDPTVNLGHVTTYVVVTLVLVAAALVACGIPAFRATRIDPMRLLREQ